MKNVWPLRHNEPPHANSPGVVTVLSHAACASMSTTPTTTTTTTTRDRGDRCGPMEWAQQEAQQIRRQHDMRVAECRRSAKLHVFPYPHVLVFLSIEFGMTGWGYCNPGWLLHAGSQYTDLFCQFLLHYEITVHQRWLRCTVVERRSLAGELSPSHARLATDG